MANSEHLSILKQGVKIWNAWREEHVGERIDLSGIEFNNSYLSGANFRGVDLMRAGLSGADLAGADFHGARLSEANMSGAKLNGADLGGATLSGTDLNCAKLAGANFTSAFLVGASLRHTELMSVQFRHANLSNADLTFANLNGSDLGYANLGGAKLSGSNFNRAMLENTNFTGAKLVLGAAVIINVDLSTALGLETIEHGGPSTIGIDTLYKSQGQIPDKFLREAGVPEEIIDIARSLRAGPAILWESSFISYSTMDDEFARRLHSRMREANMRVWFAPEDLIGGKKLHEQLFEAIQLNDRLLLVLSEHSILSEWVMTEIRKARAQEKKENRRKLFPIRLTDFDTLREWTCFDADTGKDLAVEVREYYIPDFSHWKNHDAFEAEFVKLKAALQAESARQKKKP
jgi:uncharacterized protein YjbI with pentapeptide repeats